MAAFKVLAVLALFAVQATLARPGDSPTAAVARGLLYDALVNTSRILSDHDLALDAAARVVEKSLLAEVNKLNDAVVAAAAASQTVDAAALLKEARASVDQIATSSLKTFASISQDAAAAIQQTVDAVDASIQQLGDASLAHSAQLVTLEYTDAYAENFKAFLEYYRNAVGDARSDAYYGLSEASRGSASQFVAMDLKGDFDYPAALAYSDAYDTASKLDYLVKDKTLW